MYGASLSSTFNFCDAFWKISWMCLLNFNLQSKVMPSTFSLREFFFYSFFKNFIHNETLSLVIKITQHIQINI